MNSGGRRRREGCGGGDRLADRSNWEDGNRRTGLGPSWRFTSDRGPPCFSSSLLEMASPIPIKLPLCRDGMWQRARALCTLQSGLAQPNRLG